MTDLDPADRQHMMDWVYHTEAALRAEMQPAKINLASLGNVVPHLHWHVIPRFEDDAHFPSPIWATPRREASPRAWPELAGQLRARLAKVDTSCWLDDNIVVESVPPGLSGADLACYRFFADSGLSWPACAIDRTGHVWLGLDHGNGQHERLRLEAGTYRLQAAGHPYRVGLLD